MNEEITREQYESLMDAHRARQNLHNQQESIIEQIRRLAYARGRIDGIMEAYQHMREVQEASNENQRAD